MTLFFIIHVIVDPNCLGLYEEPVTWASRQMQSFATRVSFKKASDKKINFGASRVSTPVAQFGRWETERSMFEPWVGPDYGCNDERTGGRLLILGESHYTTDAEAVGTTPENFTTDVVKHFAIANRHHFFGKLQEIVLGKPRKLQDADSKLSFWNAVAFYNYVPVLVDGRPIAEGGARRRPTDHMFRAGAEPFRAVRQRLEPKAVIVCGLELWNWVAPNLNAFRGPPRDVIFYDDGESVYARIIHPSTPGFDPDKWYHRVLNLIQLTTQPRQAGRKIMWED